MWPEFRSVAQLSMIEMRIWGVKMLRQLSELHRRNLTKQVRRCQKDLFLQGEFFNSVQSFVLWKNWVQEEENQQRKEELRQAVAAVKRQLQDCPRENLVVFVSLFFFFRFGGRKWKCPWVSWRWQMRWQWGDSKNTSPLPLDFWTLDAFLATQISAMLCRGWSANGPTWKWSADRSIRYLLC